MNWPMIQDCLICRQTSRQLVCDFCRRDLPTFATQVREADLLLWPPVANGLKNPEFHHLYALADYQWPFSQLIRGLKFSARLPYASALASWFVEQHTASIVNGPQLLIPIPLHGNRYWQRKYNQSIEICRHLSALTRINMAAHFLHRVQSTRAQSHLTAAARKTNLQNAFALPPSSLSNALQLRHIALFDDVVTTGATVNAACRCLKKRWPTVQIDVWCICVTLAD